MVDAFEGNPAETKMPLVQRFVAVQGIGVFRFVNWRRRRRWPAAHDYHMKFNIVESSLAAGVNTGSRSCSTCSVMVSPETADRKGGHLD